MKTNGTIQVTLHEERSPATTYTVAASPNNTASITVADDDSLPILSIAAPTTPISESSGSVNYTISATANPGTNFRVRYKPSEVGLDNFLNEAADPSQEVETATNLDFTGAASPYTATLPIPIHDDDVSENSGQIEVILLPDDEDAKTYRLATVTDQETLRTTIIDDEVPELTIVASELSETEAAICNSRLSWFQQHLAPTLILVYIFKPTDQGDFIGGRFSDDTSTSCGIRF